MRADERRVGGGEVTAAGRRSGRSSHASRAVPRRPAVEQGEADAVDDALLEPNQAGRNAKRDPVTVGRQVAEPTATRSAVVTPANQILTPVGAVLPRAVGVLPLQHEPLGGLSGSTQTSVASTSPRSTGKPVSLILNW